MSFHKIACGLPLVAAALLTGRTASADVVWSQNFDNIPTQNMGDFGTFGTGTSAVTFRSNTSSTASIVDLGNNNRALQFTHGDNTGRPIAYSNNFNSLMSTTNTGNNQLVGSFTYTRLVGGTAPAFQFLVDVAGQNTAGDTITAIQFTVESDGHLSYQNGLGGANTINTSFTPTVGTEYTFHISADFSSDTQDTWSLVVTSAGSPTPAFEQYGINTRAANKTVGEIALHGGISLGAVMSSSPFAQIDNINFSAQPVPEVASMGVLFGGVIGLLLRRKR